MNDNGQMLDVSKTFSYVQSMIDQTSSGLTNALSGVTDNNILAYYSGALDPIKGEMFGATWRA